MRPACLLPLCDLAPPVKSRGKGERHEGVEDSAYQPHARRSGQWLCRSGREPRVVLEGPGSCQVCGESVCRHVARIVQSARGLALRGRGNCVLQITPNGTFTATISKANLGTNNLAKAQSFSGTVVSRGNRVTLVTAQGPQLTLMRRGDSLY